MLRHRIAAALFALPMGACDISGTESVTPPDAQQEAQKKDDGMDVAAALVALPQAEVQGRHEDGIPFIITGKLGGTARGSSLRGFASGDAHRTAQLALPTLAPVFRLQASDLVVERVDGDEQGNTHIRYAQTLNGLPVVSQELIVHVNSQGEIFMVNGNARGGRAPSAAPLVSAPSAALTARRGTNGRDITTKGEPRLVYLRAGKDDTLQLAYEVRISGEGDELPVEERVFVSALNGSIVKRVSDIHPALNRAIHNANNGTSLPGVLLRGEGAPEVSDPVVNTNYDHLGTVYNCFKNVFNRDSYDNKGAPLKSSVHFFTNYNNAYWSRTDGQMVYGDGDGKTASNMVNALDVTGHELAHALIDSTSRLDYANTESGGLNESLADIFGSVCEWYADGQVVSARRTFYIGEDVWTPAILNDAVRYLDDPAKDTHSLDFYPNYSVGEDPHYSSGLSNLAFYLLAQGGTHPRGKTTTVVTGIGIEMAARIFDKANANLFVPTTTFSQAKAYTVQATIQLNYSVAVQDAVAKAWEAVGVGASPPPVLKTPLVNSTPTANLSGAKGSTAYFYLDVPANKVVTFTLSGGTGDADLYVKFNAQPTTAVFDCRSWVNGNSESCVLPAKPTAGRYEVMLTGYLAYAGASLKGTY